MTCRAVPCADLVDTRFSHSCGSRFAAAAWFTWLGPHIFYLAGGRQRISVIADWFWNYLA